MYQSLASSSELGTYVLGDSGSTVSSDLSSESLEERRRKILKATVNRLKKREEENEPR